MARATPPAEERQRLNTLRQYAVLDTAPEPVFDELTALTARLCDSPIALLSFIAESRVWFKSRFGLDLVEIAREGSFCAHTIAQRDLLIVPDTTRDERFATNPCVSGPQSIRFYAGTPVIAPTGEAIGALCVMDRRTRTLSSAQLHDLRLVSREIETHLELRRRTLALSNQDRLLGTIIDSEPECVKLLCRDGSVQMMNRAGLQMIEADSVDEVAGQTLFPLVAEEHRAAFQALTDRVFQGEAGSLEFRITGLKGSARWLETRAVPLHGDSGAVVALLGITRDITQQKRADAALRASEEKYRLLFEQAIDGIFVTDAQGRFLDVNPAACRMTGYDRVELTQMRIADLLAPHEVPRLEPEIASLSTGDKLTTEWQAYRKNGTAFIGEVTAKQLPDGHIQAFARDITERKRAEAALRESESRLRQAVHAGRVGLWDWNLETNTVYYSSEWKRQIGFDDHEISDDFDEWRRRVHPEDLPSVLQQLDAYLTGEAVTLETEFRFRHKNGSYRRILTQASKVSDHAGRVVRVLGSHVDITERAELQAQLLQAQKMETVGRLAGGIAHDFNNLLTVIIGLADLVTDSVKSDDPLRSSLQEIRQAGDRAARLTKQLLALSRQQILKPEVINLNDIVSQMRDMLQRLIGVDVTLTLALSADLGNISADPGQIEQVLLNLAVNARDAMTDGGRLTIETRNVDLDAQFAADHPSVVPGPHVAMEVRDTGVGMDEVTRKRIFEPFFTTKEPGKGTGLGLSTVYGIVKQSGGTIWVSSEPCRGTSFTIYVPRVNDVPRRRQIPPSTGATVGTETILLVEDERAIRELTRQILVSAGYTVLDAGTGEAALGLLQQKRGSVDMLLTDVVMPGMNGRELAARVAEMCPGVRVLYASGYTDDAILRHGVPDDASRFITKPYTPVELKRKIRELLDEQDLRCGSDGR